MPNKINVLTIIFLLLFQAGLSGCAAQSSVAGNEATFRNRADQITENILQAMNNDDYARYSERFDEPMKRALPEDKFLEVNQALKKKIGIYLTKEYLSMETQGIYTIVLYKAQFSDEPEGVIVRSVFSGTDGNVYVSGFWLDSPNLRK